MSHERQVAEIEAGRADMHASYADAWKARAESAEEWHHRAAAALADCKRRYQMPEQLAKSVQALLAWSPEFVEAIPAKTQCPGCKNFHAPHCGEES